MAKELWFKRKSYGWGWTPSNWKGWLVIVVYVLALTEYPLLGVNGYHEFNPTFYVTGVVILTAILIAICYFKGDKPKWQWGKK